MRKSGCGCSKLSRHNATNNTVETSTSHFRHRVALFQGGAAADKGQQVETRLGRLNVCGGLCSSLCWAKAESRREYCHLRGLLPFYFLIPLHIAAYWLARNTVSEALPGLWFPISAPSFYYSAAEGSSPMRRWFKYLCELLLVALWFAREELIQVSLNETPTVMTLVTINTEL